MGTMILQTNSQCNIKEQSRFISFLESNIPIIEYDPYQDCPPFPKSLPPDIKDLKLFYHVGIVFNWKEISHDQLVTLEKCCLVHYASSLPITYTNGNKERLLQVLQQHKYLSKNSTNVEIRLILGSKRIPWEGESMNAIHDTCHEMFPTKDHDSKTVHEGTTTETSTMKYEKNKMMCWYFTFITREQVDINQIGEIICQIMGAMLTAYIGANTWNNYLFERQNLCMHILTNGPNTCGPPALFWKLLECFL